MAQRRQRFRRQKGQKTIVLPAEHAEHQIQHEEGTQQNEGNKVDPGPFVPHGIVNLKGKSLSATDNSFLRQYLAEGTVLVARAETPTPENGRQAVPAATDPVQDFGPPLHGDALVDCKHGKADVIEVRDAVVGTLPARPTL